MGYFNFIYKLSRILSNKKLLKAFIFIVLICLLIFSLSNTSQAVSSYNEDYADPYNAFTTNYGAIQRDFIMRLANGVADGSISTTQLARIKDRITSGDYVFYTYYSTLNSYNNSSPLTTQYLSLLLIPHSYITANQTTNYDWFGIKGISQYTVTTNGQPFDYFRFNGSTLEQFASTSTSTLCPYGMLNYYDPLLSWYFSNVVSDDGSTSSALNQIVISLGQVSANTEDTSEELGEIKDFIKDKNANDSSYSQNSTSVTDNYSSSVNDLYSDIVEAFGVDGGFAQSIVLPIPFTEKTITIPSTLVSSRVSGTFIETIVTLFWWYIIGSFILKDILKYIDKLKSGDVISSSDTNIKADML